MLSYKPVIRWPRSSPNATGAPALPTQRYFQDILKFDPQSKFSGLRKGHIPHFPHYTEEEEEKTSGDSSHHITLPKIIKPSGAMQHHVIGQT